MVTDEDMQTKVKTLYSTVNVQLHVSTISLESMLLKFTHKIYEYHCEEITGPLANHFATTYGIVRNCILNQCNFFMSLKVLYPI